MRVRLVSLVVGSTVLMALCLGSVRRREAEEELFRRDGYPALDGESEEETKLRK